jgi:hypothetical protein
VDRQRAEFVRAEHAGTADEQREVERVAIAVVRPEPGRPELPRFVVDPIVEVLRGERRSSRRAGRPAGGGDVDDLPLGRGAQVAEGRLCQLSVAQNLLVDEREALEVVERLQVARMNARRVEMTAIEGRVLVGEGEMPLEVSQRVGRPGGAALDFQRRVPIGLRRWGNSETARVTSRT